MTRVRLALALLILVAAVIDVIARIEDYRPAWFWVVPLTLLAGTAVNLFFYLKVIRRDA